MAKATKSAAQVRKKRWAQILAPKLFNEQLLGESYVVEPKDLLGKTVSVSAAQLINEPGRQFVSLGFTITGMTGDTLHTELKSYKILPGSLRRLVRRSKDKIDGRYIVATKGVPVLIKPMVVLRGKATGGVLTGLRAALKARIANLAISLTPEDLIVEILSGRFQRAIVENIRKVYPVGACEMRWVEFMPEGTTPDVVGVPIEAKPQPKAPEEVVEETVQADEVPEEASEEAEEETPEEPAEDSEDAEASEEASEA